MSLIIVRFFGKMTFRLAGLPSWNSTWMVSLLASLPWTFTITSKEEPPQDAGQSAATVEKLPKVALLVKKGNLLERLKMARLKKAKWEDAGTTAAGVPLCIDSASISHPSESNVKMLMKAWVDKKDYINMLEINCTERKLRILEERSGKNPVLSAYSRDWQKVLLETSSLFNSACSKK